MIDRLNPTISRMLHEEKATRLMREAEIERTIRDAKESPERPAKGPAKRTATGTERAAKRPKRATKKRS
jgi:hypothetical protein